MRKKYIFVDLDNTVLDHSINAVRESTKLAISKAQENGHEVLICTGRPPCLLYGLDKQLGIDSYVAANGRVMVYKDEMVLSDNIPNNLIEKIIELGEELKIDIGFEGMNGFKLQSKYDNIYEKFSKNFNLEVPELHKNYYLEEKVYQLTFYYQESDYKKFEKDFPELQFAYSCAYGIDVNTKGGLKERGIQAFMDKENIDLDDIIVIGDGHNDISMLDFANTSIAMGNASENAKKHATYLTDDIKNNGVKNGLIRLGLLND